VRLMFCSPVFFFFFLDLFFSAASSSDRINLSQSLVFELHRVEREKSLWGVPIEVAVRRSNPKGYVPLPLLNALKYLNNRGYIRFLYFFFLLFIEFSFG